MHDESVLWQRWRASRDAGARRRLLAMHLPYARTVAKVYYARRRHDEIGFDDYLQLSLLGMLESFDRFDPRQGTSFRTFASRRMHGSILDGLDAATEKQRQIASRRWLMQADRECLLRTLATSGFGVAVCQMLQDTGMVDHADGSNRSEADPQIRAIELAQLRSRLRSALDGLAPQQRIVIRCHYLQEHSFEDVAATLRVTRGRVSQIHRAALDLLRERLGAAVRDAAEAAR